jgi:ribosomal protein S18 acetylase RimI-like enzyme
MEGGQLKIVRCPAARVAEALSVVLTDVAPSQRREIAGPLLVAGNSTAIADEPLFIALRGEQLCGAAWGQRQPGNVAVFWPPRLMADEDIATGSALAAAVVGELDKNTIELTQVLVSEAETGVVPVLEHVHFRRLAELLYLTCEASRFPREPPIAPDIAFTLYNESQRSRLKTLIERSYDGTLDCVGLNGVREVDNVITGYQGTGTFRPENWLIVTANNEDVGVLLLADHPMAGHWELMYMGLVPEARGRRWGRQITQHALWLARRASVERIVLAVDAVNEPAVRMYRSAGFEMWDRRTVYIRFPEKRKPGETANKR